jgi:hypothetical protein
MRRSKGPSRGRNQRPAQALPTPATPRQTPFEREQTTKRRGEISELAFALAAARQGFGIARPYGDSERYDIILDSSHLPSVIPTEAERKRAQSRACPEPAKGDVLLAPARPRLIRVQVKATTQLQYGLYRANAHRRILRKSRPLHSRRNRFLRRLRHPRRFLVHLPPDPHPGRDGRNPKPQTPPQTPRQRPLPREAWHLLREPDGIEFA